MTIYLIEPNKEYDYVEKLSTYGKVVQLDSGESAIRKYPELFANDEPKVIGLNTGVIDWKFPVDEMKKIKNLKGIASKSSWVFYLDLEYCKDNEIVVTNVAGANSQSVAEYAIWMMLSLAKKLPLQLESHFKTKLDKQALQTEIEGKTMGVVGLGNIGKRIATMGKGLGMNVVYWSPRTKEKGFDYMELDDLLEQSDFIFNCVEIYDQTKDLFDKEKLDLMKKGAYFISVLGGMGWGPEDDNYLVELVQRGHLAGFAIENAHEPAYEVAKVQSGDNVFIPGSYAYYTHESQERSNQMWVEGIIGIVTKNYVRRVV